MQYQFVQLEDMSSNPRMSRISCTSVMVTSSWLEFSYSLPTHQYNTAHITDILSTVICHYVVFKYQLPPKSI